jgi:hypothetical protein
MRQRLFSQSLALNCPIIPIKIVRNANQRIVSSIDLPYQMASDYDPFINTLLTTLFLGGSRADKFHTLRDSAPCCIQCAMKQRFNMDDRARLPWRFFGAMTTVLASL